MASKANDENIVPKRDDVLLGRAADVFHHPGNARYRHLITMNLHTFQQCRDRLDKMNLIKQVTLEVLDNGRVRFLRQHEKHLWKEVTFRTAYDKVSHALRDGIKKTVFPTVKPTTPKPVAPTPFTQPTLPSLPLAPTPAVNPMLLRRSEFEPQHQHLTAGLAQATDPAAFRRSEYDPQRQFTADLSPAPDPMLLRQSELESQQRQFTAGLSPIPDPMLMRRAEFERQQHQRQNNDSSLLFQHQLQNLLGEIHRNDPTTAILNSNYMGSLSYPSRPSIPHDCVPPTEMPLPHAASPRADPIQNVRLPEPVPNVRVSGRRRPEKDLGFGNYEEPQFHGYNNPAKKNAPSRRKKK